MAKQGEYRIARETEFQQVHSRPRRYTSMFNPAASRSRLRIVDSGRRYELRLTEAGVVEYSLDGTEWKPIQPAPDPCSGQVPPLFLSYNRSRAGEEVGPVKFDMIAACRGRVLAKEAGTDRVFHLVMDELFRTHDVTRPHCKLTSQNPNRTEDPPVPGTYWKLDPEFFVSGNRTPAVPPELTGDFDYSNHPASARFRVFRELLTLEIVDAMLVAQRPRVWYLVDARSPLMITGPEDLRISEPDFKAEFDDVDTVKAIITASYETRKQDVENALEDIINGFISMVGFWTDAVIVGLGATIGGGLGTIVGLIAGSLAGAVIGGLAGAVLGGIGAAIVKEFIKRFVRDKVVPFIVKQIVAGLAPGIIDTVSKKTRDSIQAEGFGALVLPATFGLLWGLFNLRKPMNGARALDTKQGSLALHPGKTFDRLSETFPENKPLSDSLSNLMLKARGGDPVPNSPPLGIPVYPHVTYIRDSDGDEQDRPSIQFSEVLDLGVGYSHWSEQWNRAYGTEINNLAATRPIAQQEQYNLLQYRLLNGPVVDADGYNDGTCNFYMLVKLGKYNPNGGAYAILWMDEQSYITQRWRLLHPSDDVRGDWFSVQRVLSDNQRENQDWFRFDPANYWSPFEDDCIDERSRMLVRRQLVAVTGRAKGVNQSEIYTTCFNYGVCDYTWRWRKFPEGEQRWLSDEDVGAASGPLPTQDAQRAKGNVLVYVNSVELRDDLTFHVRGFMRLDAGNEVFLREVRWFQPYLPVDLRHMPRRDQLQPGRKPAIGFAHPWQLVSEAAFRRADKFYQFGVYEDPIESRCQYYEVELLTEEEGDPVPPSFVAGRVWRNDPQCSKEWLSINTDNVNLNFTKLASGYIPLTRDNLMRERRKLTMSMYESTTRFRLLERRPKGLLAVFFDKRDDELQAASHLPREAVFCLDSEESEIPEGWEDEAGGDRNRPRKAQSSAFPTACPYPAPFPPPRVPVPRKIRLLIKSNVRVTRPPVVTKVRVGRETAAGVTSALWIRFWTPFSVDEVYENIWKIRLAALDETGVIPLFESEIFGVFVRLGIPAAPLPFDHVGDLDDAYCYEHRWTGFDASAAALLDKYCSSRGRFEYATSAWFEDIVGHRSTPSAIVFDDAVTAPVAL